MPTDNGGTASPVYYEPATPAFNLAISEADKLKYELTGSVTTTLTVESLKDKDKHNRSQQAERDAYKEELSKNETEEDLGDISITIPTDAPDNAAGKDTTSSSDKSSNTDSADSGSDSEK